jgi:hypothetical protein
MVDLSSWPERSRLIVRRERPHPGAQLSFTDPDGYRCQAIQSGSATTRDTGLSKFPFEDEHRSALWIPLCVMT